MNLNLDGTPVTNDQMVQMCRDLGITDEDLSAAQAVNDHPPMWMSWLETQTRQLRWEMCMRGQLVCDTRQPFVPKPHPPVMVDPFFLNQSKTGACA